VGSELGQAAVTDRDWRRAYNLAKQRWRYQMVRLDHDDAEALRALAKRDGTTVAELIRTFVAWGLENDYKGADRE
jgi:Ribbon-helix-helix protein, copG family